MKKVVVQVSLLSLFLVWLSYSLGSHAGLYSTQNQEQKFESVSGKPTLTKRAQAEKVIQKTQEEKIEEKTQSLAKPEEIKDIELAPRIPTSQSPFLQPLSHDFENSDLLDPNPTTENLPEHFSNQSKSILENVDFYIFTFETRDFARNFLQEVRQFRQEYKVDPDITDEELIFTVESFFPRTVTYHVYIDGGEEYLGELHSTSVPSVSEESLLLLVDKNSFQKDKRRLIIKKPKKDILPRELKSFFNILTSPLPRENYIETDELTHFDIYEINPVLYVLERF